MVMYVGSSQKTAFNGLKAILVGNNCTRYLDTLQEVNIIGEATSEENRRNVMFQIRFSA